MIACGGGAVLGTEHGAAKAERRGVLSGPAGGAHRGDIRLSTRPLLKQGKERLYQLYRERAELYEKRGG